MSTRETDSRRLLVRCECGVSVRIPRLPFRCSCGAVVTTAEHVGETPFEPPVVSLPPPVPPKGFGPGTEVQRILTAVGEFLHRWLPCTRRWRINHLDCGCGNHIAVMDDLGPAGCRNLFGTAVGWLARSAEKQGWIAPATTLRGRIGHPAARLVAAAILELAIRRSEAAEAAERVKAECAAISIPCDTRPE